MAQNGSDGPQRVIGEEGVLTMQLELFPAQRTAILARQTETNARGTEEFRAEVRLHSVLKHRVFVEIVKRHKPQVVIDVYGGFIIHAGESSQKAIPEKSVEVGSAGRILSLMEPSLQKFIINDKRYDHSALETPRKFGSTTVFATNLDISLDNIPTQLRAWKKQHIRDEDTRVLILVDPYESMTQKQLKSLFTLRGDLNDAAFLVFSKLTAANAILPRTKLLPRKGESDMSECCLRQCFLDSQHVYTIYNFGISSKIWSESLETAFDGKGMILPFKEVGYGLFERRVDELKKKLQEPGCRPIVKTKWEQETKQITENILSTSSAFQHLEPVICVSGFTAEVVNLILPLCLYSVLFDDRRKVFDINSINNIQNQARNYNKVNDIRQKKRKNASKKRQANAQTNGVSIQKRATAKTKLSNLQEKVHTNVPQSVKLVCSAAALTEHNPLLKKCVKRKKTLS